MSDNEQPGASGVMIQSDASGEIVTTKRRRKADENAWKKVIAKTRRNLGQEYTSEKTGKKIHARQVRGPCQCSNKCYDKVPASVREKIHKHFWKIGSYNLQNAYLGKLLKCNTVKRRRKPVETAERFRRHSASYNVFNGTEEIRICRIAFLNIFDLGEKRVKNILEKQTGVGISIPDRRGKSTPAIKIHESRVETVREHISKLSAAGSHFTNTNSPNRKYLNADLNVTKLYTLYQDFMSERHPEVQPVSESKYRSIFNEEFNKGFAPNKTDTCNAYDLLQANIDHYDSSPTPTREKLEESLKSHKDLAAKGLPIKITSVIKNNDTSLERITKEKNMTDIEEVFIKVENGIEVAEETQDFGGERTEGCEDTPYLPPAVDNRFKEESCDTLSEGDEVMVKEEDFDEYYFSENAENGIYYDESSTIDDLQFSGGNSEGIAFQRGDQDLDMESTLEIKEEILEYDNTTHHYEDSSFLTLGDRSNQYNHEDKVCKTSAYSVSAVQRKQRQEEERQKLQVSQKKALTQGQRIGMVYDRYAMLMNSKDKKKDFFSAVIKFMVNYASTIEES